MNHSMKDKLKQFLYLLGFAILLSLIVLQIPFTARVTADIRCGLACMK